MFDKMVKGVVLMFVCACFFSCEDAFKKEYAFEKHNLIVVDGLITNEKKAHKVIVSYPVTQLNEKALPATGADVFISDNDTVYVLNESKELPGTYLTDTDFSAVINRTYTLGIFLNGKEYFAQNYMVPVSPFNSLKYSYSEQQNKFFIDSVSQSFDTDESAFYQVEIDWQQVPGFQMVDKSEKKAMLYYYTLSTIDISEVFAPEKETVFFPSGTTIVETKYSLNEAHAAFIRSMLLETEWRGGLFDVEKSNIETNLSEGAVGYFGVSTVVRDTILVE